MEQTPEKEFASSLLPGGPGNPIVVATANDLNYLMAELGPSASEEFVSFVLIGTPITNPEIIERLKRQKDITSKLLLDQHYNGVPKWQ
jgi:hypothetical protein